MLKSAQISEMLGNVPMFKALPQPALERLAGLCAIDELAAGNVLFLEGNAGQAFFLLKEGLIKIFKTAPDGQEVALKLINPDTIFGEVILFENNSYPVSAMAVKASKLVRIPREAFLRILDEPSLRNAFIGRLMEYQRYLSERLVYLTAYDVEERFVRFLIGRYGQHNEIHMDISKKEIASLIGTIPETFSRLINRLKAQNQIEWEGDTIKFAAGYLDSFELET